MRCVRRIAPLLVLLFAACASTPKSEYVPGGTSLPGKAKREYRRALDLERAGDSERALALLGDLCTRYPLMLGIHLRRLRLALDTEGVEAAVALYEPPPPGVDPERAAVLVALARTPDDDIAARTAILESATARLPENALWRLALADVRLTAHDIAAARAKREGELGNVQAAAVSAEEAARLLEEARQDAETALQYDPDLMEAHLMLGFLYTRKADLEPKREDADAPRRTAEYHYTQAIAKDPACLSARLNLAENYLYFGNYKDAAKQLEVALRLAPKEPIAWNNLGYTYYSLGYLDDAVTAYGESLRLDPSNARVRTALADGLRRLDKPEEAVTELIRARKDAGDDRELQAEIALKLAAIHEQEKRYREAVLEYQRYIDLGGSQAAKAESRLRAIYEGAFER